MDLMELTVLMVKEKNKIGSSVWKEEASAI